MNEVKSKSEHINIWTTIHM